MPIIEQAVKIIKQGGLVAFPTETVYGLGADATNQSACLKIYKMKGRPSHNPIIVHVSSVEQAKEYANFDNRAYKLSELWPAPLTIVLPKKQNIKLADCVSANLETIAIRIPAHDIARQLIQKSGCPIAAPSANKSGRLSPTEYSHVIDNFGDDVFVIKQDKSSIYGLESTIIDLSTEIPTILRYGFITHNTIENILGEKIIIASKLSKIKAPGMLLQHYSPQTKIRLNAHSLKENEIGLGFGKNVLDSDYSLNLSKTANLVEAASNLFSHLHKLDKYAQEHGIEYIAISPIPHESVGIAINDRLSRAAYVE
jgi:L-threonylcarbamoyladenylate synthase